MKGDRYPHVGHLPYQVNADGKREPVDWLSRVVLYLGLAFAIFCAARGLVLTVSEISAWVWRNL